MMQSSPRTPTTTRYNRPQQNERCNDIIGMREQIESNIRSLFGRNFDFEIIVCENLRPSDCKALWTARIVRPDMGEVYLEGRTHRDVCSALYGLLSETARALEEQLQGAVKRFRAVEMGKENGGLQIGLLSPGSDDVMALQ